MANRGALGRDDRREQLEHQAAEARLEPALACGSGDGFEPPSGLLRVGGGAVVQSSGVRLPLDVRPARLVGDAVDLVCEARCLGLELEAVLADVAELGHADDSLRIGARSPRHARDEAVAACEPPQLPADGVGHARPAGIVDDRREHAVDVEEQRRRVWIRGEA